MFAGLADRVATAWARVDHAADAFPEIAADALIAGTDATFDTLIDWLFDAPALPPQRTLDQAFGQPPVTVYRDDRFFIELLFWHSGTTGIHQHAFAGAFRVLVGSSLHAIYDFAPHTVTDPRLELGALALRRTEILETGAVRAIHPGRALIHSAFHLDNPSVTLVVRTHADASREFEYKPPGLAIDPSARDAHATKLMQLMPALRDGLSPRVAKLVERCDAYTGVQLLLRARRHVDAAGFAALLEPFRVRFPAVGERLGAVADEEIRRAAVAKARERIVDPDHRFLLALLMNLPDRSAILDAIRQRVPKRDPGETLMTWLAAIARRDRLGVELDAPLLAIVRDVVEGRPAMTPATRRAYEVLQRIPALAPLFADRCVELAAHRAAPVEERDVADVTVAR